MPETLPCLHPWCVWHRPRKGVRWTPVLGAATEDDAVRQAIARRLGGDWCVQADGRDPNHRPGKSQDAALVAATARAIQAGDSRTADRLRGALAARGVTVGMPGGSSDE
jgi:hypothetical protein